MTIEHRHLQLHLIAAFDKSSEPIGYAQLREMMSPPPDVGTLRWAIRGAESLGLIRRASGFRDRRTKLWERVTTEGELVARIASQAFYRAKPADLTEIARTANVATGKAARAVLTLQAEGFFRALPDGTFEINE